MVPYPDFRAPYPDFRVPYPDFRVPYPDFMVPYPDFRVSYSYIMGPYPDFRVPYPEIRVWVWVLCYLFVEVFSFTPFWLKEAPNFVFHTCKICKNHNILCLPSLLLLLRKMLPFPL